MKEFMLSQKEFSDYLGVGITTYCNWENNSSRPSLEKALKISKKLNKSIEEIWCLEE